MFKGGEGVGSGHTILKGAAEYVPADVDGAVGRIVIDTTKTKDIHRTIAHSVRSTRFETPFC